MKLSLCFPRERSDGGAIARRMAEAQRFLDADACEVLEVAHGALAITRGSERHSRVPMFHRSASGNLLLLSGVPIHYGRDVTEHLRATVDLDVAAATRALTEIDGPFVAIHWDAAAKRLLIVTDALGMMPFYIAHGESGLAAATEMKACAASGLVSLEPDIASWGSFLTFGNFVGNQTWLSHAVRAPMGSVLVYDPERNELSSSKYWDYPAARPRDSVDDVDIEPIVDAVRRDVRACLAHSSAGTVLLSGGFDSRMLLTILIEEGRHPSVLLLDHPDEHLGADDRFARRAARRLGLPYERRTPPATFFASAEYLDYLIASEAATRSLHLFIAQLAMHLEGVHDAVWEGVALGNFLRPPGADQAATLSQYVESASRPWQSSTWSAARKLFGETRAAAMRDAAAAVLREETAPLADDSEGRVRFVLRNRMRSRTATNPLKVYSNFAFPLTPGLSRDLANACATIPYAQSNHRLYFRIYRQYFQKAGRDPYCSGGILLPPATGGPDAGYLMMAAACSPAGRRLVRAWQKRFATATPSAPSPTLVDRVVALAEPNDEWLDPAALEAARRTPAGSPDDVELRRVLFYWQVSRWVIEGRLGRAPSPLRSALLEGLADNVR